MNRPLRSRPRRAIGAALTVAALAALAALPALGANPGTATTGTGQPLNVRIDTPADGASIAAAALDVTGVAGLGPLTGKGATNLLYVLDNSGSTGSNVGDCNGDGTTDASDDFNGDKSVGTTLDCEISGAVALNASLRATAVQAGAIAFGDQANQGDVGPAAGQQDFSGAGTDGNANGVADVEEALRSINGYGFGVFTATTTTGGGTSFNNAITQINTAFAGKAGQRNIAAFLSDGGDTINEAAGSPVDVARAAGTRINTYSVGKSAAGCTSTTSALKKIADITGGTCTEVQDPTKLSATISGGAAAAGLKGVTVSVNGGAATAASVTSLGNWSLTVPASKLRSGSNQILATATASDGTAAKASITVNVGAGGATYGTAVGLPSSRKCISKRLFPIKVRQIRGVKYDFATIVVNGKKVRVYVKSGKRWIRTGRPSGKVLNVRVFTAYVDLRGLVKGRYSVKIVVVATNGRVVTGKRTYRTCSRRLTGSVPKL